MHAQSFSTVHPTSASLMGWEYNMRMLIFDRHNSRLGPFDERGIFQRYLRGMDDEFDLDIFTFRFTPDEDFLFFRSPGAFRSSMGILGNERIMAFSEFRNVLEIAPDHAIILNLTHQDDLHARRAYVDIGYQWNFNEQHHVGIQHNVTGDKAFLNATVFYQYGNPQTGFLRFDVTAVNYLNNIVFDTLRDNLSDVDTVRVYDNQPLFFSAAMVSPNVNGFRAEAFAGYQLPTSMKFSSLNILQQEYRQEEWVHYLGGLLEYIGEYATFGLIHQREFTKMRRDSVGNSVFNPDFGSRQIQNRTGLYVLAGAEYIRWETWLWLIEASDEQFGDRFDTARIDAFRFAENRVMLRNRFSYIPRHSGIVGGLEYLLDTRNVKRGLEDMRFLAYRIHDLNARLTLIGGYQFHPRARVVAGVGFDVDADFHVQDGGARYDNAFLRMEYRW